MSITAERPLFSKLQTLAKRGGAELHYLRKVIEAGMLKLDPPNVLAAIGRDLYRFGEIGAVPSFAAHRSPTQTAIIDDEGSLTYAELNDSINALAHGLIRLGIKGGDGVAILARNHRWFIIANYAAHRAGARVILLNTDFSGPQTKEVADREGARLLIYDTEYTEFLDGYSPELGRLAALPTNPENPDQPAPEDETLESVIKRNSTTPAPRPAKYSSLVILTSGTTGTPKGAPRKLALTLAPVGGMFSHVPFRSGEITSVPAPMFHALGYLHQSLALSLGCTLILHRKFKPENVLADIEKHRVTAIVVVPVMLNRLLNALDEAESKPDLSSLRIAFVSGSQLGGELASRALDTLGPVIYNLYGSTEVAFATIARPQDLAINPATVGPVVKGATVKILDDEGNPVPQGTIGRIFVGNAIPFEGYTGGGHKQIIDGLMSSGDVGYFDEHGLLYVSGRDDEMIVSGGENVFPAEIEDLISGHPEVVEATALGVDDPDWGARLRAFVVRHPESTLDADGIRSYVRDNLARYKVPRDVVFLDILPRNPSGKILKRQLRELEV
ncbi:acyl-CoA synthetase [Mycobacterium sp. CBMA271]|uniref:long-chain-fatty-acid--CoA ligase FadD2 n=1 Tax=unclassified Mycobacteroides TaxID=2618759 RepID=UPI0012DDFEE5|nr:MULTISPECIES: long-chain-fatty-acid--CoA ligase FadD2 [unclassified Mycobacteroides]MUM19428.1 acyl-CoA synthetase [Mycobacteroides sp. CBMA 326]MUM21398.1 acyl-CoA synthetase [Mycobacteroides sp. CBMA 271]